MFFVTHAIGAMLALAPTPTPSPSPPPQIAHAFTADRSDRTLDNTARTAFVVTRDDIARNGYRTIGDALATVPGVESWPQGAIGSNFAFGIRGSGSSQVLVLVDGLPAPGMFSNTVELGNLPLTGIDRIEVVEGGGSTLYGTGAAGGIINVITQRSAQYGASARYGSFGDKELYVDTPRVQIARTVATNAFGLPGGGTRPDSDYASSSLHAGEAWRIGSFEAALRAALQSDTIGVPGGDAFLSPTSREADVNEDANLTLTRKTAQALLTSQFGGSRQQILFSCNSVTDPNCGVLYPALTAENRLDFGVRDDVESAGGQTMYGIDLSRGFVRSDSGGFVPKNTAPISVDALAQTAAYVQRRADAAWGSVYGGLRGERDGSLGGEFSPSAGVVVHLSAEASIKANAATAFRAPNAAELYFPGLGNPALVPERAKVADISIVDSRAAGGGAALTWFMNRTNSLIAYNFTTNQLEQIDHALMEGFTFDVKTLPYRGVAASLNLTNLYRAENLDTQTRLSNDPVLTSNLRLDYSSRNAGAFDGWGIALRIAGRRGNVNPYLPAFDQPVEFATANAFVRFRSGLTLFTLRAYNLGNERYAAVAGYPMPGRSFAFEVSTK